MATGRTTAPDLFPEPNGDRARYESMSPVVEDGPNAVWLEVLIESVDCHYGDDHRAAAAEIMKSDWLRAYVIAQVEEALTTCAIVSDVDGNTTEVALTSLLRDRLHGRVPGYIRTRPGGDLYGKGRIAREKAETDACEGCKALPLDGDDAFEQWVAHMDEAHPGHAAKEER